MLKMIRMKSVALRLMMMMMMVVACVFTGPLPPPFRSDYSNSTNVPQQKQKNMTRLEDLQTNENMSRSDYSNSTNVPQQKQENVTSLEDLQPEENMSRRRDFVFNLERAFSPQCFLPSCALVNLGHSLQIGDETAGSATRDSLGYGKK